MTAVLTNGAVLNRYEISTDGIERLDLEVPVLTGPQAQGDVLVLPVAPVEDPGTEIPKAGVTVVSSERISGNAHILHVLDGVCFWRPAPAATEALTQGWLTVPDGSVATLIHTDEHNILAIGFGTYKIRRQREFAGEWRRVSD